MLKHFFGLTSNADPLFTLCVVMLAVIGLMLLLCWIDEKIRQARRKQYVKNIRRRQPEILITPAEPRCKLDLDIPLK